MKTFALVGLLAVATTLTGCKEDFPEKYREYGFTRDGLFSSFDDDHSMTALYEKGRDQGELVTDWDKQLGAKGFKQFCEKKFDDGSIARGYEGKSRYLFTAGKLGDAGIELHLTEIPAAVPKEEVCKDSAE